MTNELKQGRTGDRPMPDIFFRGMSAMFKIRDIFQPPDLLLDEVPIEHGDTILDYGCGPGSYIPVLAERAGTGGKVIAVDIHPLALQRVEVLSKRLRLPNVNTILTDGIHLPELVDGSVNAVILFDVFHMLGDQKGVLAEIYRVLRSSGILCVNDPHMVHDNLAAGITCSGHFTLVARKTHITTFSPVPHLRSSKVLL